MVPAVVAISLGLKIYKRFLCYLTVKEDEGRTLWLDTQSHASSSASSADEDYSWQWPTSFWSQFKVSNFEIFRTININITCVINYCLIYLY